MLTEAKSMQSFGHKCSFRHNLNNASNQKTSFMKVIEIGSLSKEMLSEAKNAQSFGHKRSFCHNLNHASVDS
jgi:hypothetical protein